MSFATSHFDVIVLGQGLAGTALTWALRWAGFRVLVVDRESPITSSKIAAGLMTPITGQKLTKTWRHSSLWPAAISFYRRVEEETGVRFFRQTPMVRLLANENERHVLERRAISREFEDHICQPNPLVDERWFRTDHGGFEMSPGGQLDVPSYLAASREQFRRDGGYVATDVDVSREIELAPNQVRIPRLQTCSNLICFCQGINAVDNPWFREVEFKPAKGEILTLRIPGLSEARVVHHGVWLAPLGADLFRAGSTYDWKQLDTQPTTKGLNEILDKLRAFLRLPFEVVSHEAAVRPIHKNQYPVIGQHPSYPQLGYFNGLGSKGSLQAPFFASQFVSHFKTGSTIDPAVDLNRKTNWNQLPLGSPEADRSGSNGGFHVERIDRRPLTEQAQAAVRKAVRSGDCAIDATAGNGHDTQFLAELVGPGGTVFAFDIQQAAIEQTSARLIDAGLRNVILLNHDHAQLTKFIPNDRRERIAAVMFNLGYLPSGDKSVTTQPESTRGAILRAAEFLMTGGVLTILAYTGHDGGTAEARAVEETLGILSREEFGVSSIESQPGRKSGPRMFLVERIAPPGNSQHEKK